MRGSRALGPGARVVPADQLYDEALAVAEKIAGFSLPVDAEDQGSRSIARTNRRSPRACCSSAANFIRRSRSTTRRKACAPSSKAQTLLRAIADQLAAASAARSGVLLIRQSCPPGESLFHAMLHPFPTNFVLTLVPRCTILALAAAGCASTPHHRQLVRSCLFPADPFKRVMVMAVTRNGLGAAKLRGHLRSEAARPPAWRPCRHTHGLRRMAPSTSRR